VGTANARESAFAVEPAKESNPGESDLNVYPNPFAIPFKLEVRNSGEPFQFELFDRTGKEIGTVMHAGKSGPVTQFNPLTIFDSILIQTSADPSAGTAI
jgi:hypothetical protein